MRNLIDALHFDTFSKTVRKSIMLPLMIAALSLSQHHYANAENSTPKSWADDNESKEYIDQRSLIIGGDEVSNKMYTFCMTSLTMSSSFVVCQLVTRFCALSHCTLILFLKVSEGAYSYVVSLKDQSGHFCGGSLIAPDVVLTAAHCIFLDDMEYNVTIGRRDLDDVSVGEEISVKEDLPYPNYDMMKSDDFDCGLILLTRAANVTLEDLVKLNSNKSAPIPGETVSFAGWGDTTSDDEIDVGSSVLRQVETIVIPNEECENSEGNHGGFDQSYNGVITDNMLCTFSEDKDSCQRDSGE